METLMARREVFAKAGPFDTRLQTAEDLDWFARQRPEHSDGLHPLFAVDES
jgi:hypothetical protein